ncbi:NADH-quinone oxidoreductase subunit N [Angustibacter luteus]|uniref:NADH-quinone oxidoreductase subunit N n=1 Tax=Angustibacter luteus TaxID=658456 RepID=A0ABW1JF55_9ACTN
MSGVPGVDVAALLPWLAPAAGAVIVLAVDAALPRGRGRRVLDVVAVLSLVVAIVSLAPLANGTRATFCSSPGACGYEASRLTFAIQIVVLLSALICLLLALADDQEPTLPRAELLLLLLAATAGACALAGARDLATFAVAFETASLPIIGLVALRRDGRGAEAGVKLLLTAVLSFGVLALGLALLYASSGSLMLGAGVSDRLGDLRLLHGLGLALVVAGAAFKLSLVPFHLWTPDTYAGAPLPVAAFLSTVSKGAGLAAVVLVLALGAPERAADWAVPVGAVAALTMTVGNLVALRQDRAVRLLAWSTVAQAGWVLLPLAGAVGQSRLAGAVAASVAYLFAYVAGTLAVFAVVARVARTAVDGAGHRLDAYAGMWRRSPGLALVLTFGLLCLAGLPPGVVGLVAKVVALVPVIGVGAWWLVAAAVANVVLGVAVYLRWAVQVFSAGPELAEPPSPGPMSGRMALSIAAAGCIALSLLPEGIVGLLAGSPLR